MEVSNSTREVSASGLSGRTMTGKNTRRVSGTAEPEKKQQKQSKWSSDGAVLMVQSGWYGNMVATSEHIVGTARHEDFQSRYSTGTMWHHWSSTEWIQASEGAPFWLNLPIGTHCSK